MREAAFTGIGPAVTVAFTLFWAAATLFDKGWYGHWKWTPTNIVVAAACATVFAFPRSARALLFLAVAQIADWFSDQSIMGNHAIILAMVNATILLAAVSNRLGRSRPGDDAGEILSTAVPGIRLEVLALYSWATFHKLNADFLSVGHSCVTLIATDPVQQPWLFRVLPAGPGWLEAGIHGTLVVEALISALLAFRKTRGAGILLAVWFHSFLSSGPRNGFYAFAVVVLPLLWLFASEEAMGRLLGLGRAIVGRRGDPMVLVAARVAGFATIAWASLAARNVAMSRTFPAWIALDGVVLVWALAQQWKGIGATGDRRSGGMSIASPLLAVMPVVFFLNGACPYLGLKTETSFAMLSNLRTEGGRSNHLIVPAGVAPFRFLDEIVEVLDSSDPGLRRIAATGKAFIWYDLRRRAWIDPSIALSFVRNGETVVVETVRARPDLIPPVSWWAGRLMPSRPVQTGDACHCQH